MIFQRGKSNLRLRDERIRRHWSQQELADMIGATLNTVSRWERGLTDCSPYFRNKLCEVLGKDAKQLWLVPDLDTEPAQPTLYDPALPAARKLVGRDELLSQLKGELCSTHEESIFALLGMPGVGKSALAVALAHDVEIKERFYEGILWVDVSHQPNMLSILSRWGALLGVELGEHTDLTVRDAWLLGLRTAIGMRRMLIILDNVWRLEDAMVLLHVGGPYCTYLVTTRFINIALHTAGERMSTVPELTEEHGLQLLAQMVPAVVKAEPERSQWLVQSVGGLPLALVLIGQYLRLEAHNRQPRRLRLALEHLYHPEKRLQLKQPLVALEQPTMYSTRSLQEAIALSDRHGSKQAQDALRLLSAFPARPSTFSEQAALAVTGAPAEIFDQLSDAGLLESRGPDRYSLHRCIVDYAALQADNLLAERRLTDYFTNFVEAHQDEYQICKQEQINLFAALLFTYKYRMVEAREKLIAAFFARLDSSVLDDLVSEALKYILPCLRSTEDFDALTRVLYHLEKAEWIQFAACDYQTSAYERTSVILTNLVSLGSYARV
ncbi:MAG: NB-ARC domain-containing protein [Ktedonobacteraceae bacterium]